MLTLDALCERMEASNRHLSRRAARDWWTKGLLPRPQRHGLGRRRGTETYWKDARVSWQAMIVYDLLGLHSRADITLLSIWLLGFPANLHSIRTTYRKLINRHLCSVHGQRGKQPDDIVGKFADVLARAQTDKAGAPVGARQALSDLALEFLGAFYGVRGDVASSGLAELWEIAVPYIGSTGSRPSGLADLHPSDEDLATWAKYVREFGSLTAQLQTIGSASDYELMRARRLVYFVLGYLGRFAHVTCYQEKFETMGRRLLIQIARPAIPILIAIFRQETFRHRIMVTLLDLTQMLPRPAEWPTFLRDSAVVTNDEREYTSTEGADPIAGAS